MKLKFRLKGGPGSGHEGHAGRPGSVGGSVPGTGNVFESPPANFVSGMFKGSYGEDILIKRRGTGLIVYVGQRKGLVYKRNQDGDYIRQRQRVLIKGDKVKFEYME